MVRLRTTVIVGVTLLLVATAGSLWMTAWPRWQDQPTEAAVAGRRHQGHAAGSAARSVSGHHHTASRDKAAAKPAKLPRRPPAAVYSPSPAYPIQALRQHREGMVTLRVSVDPAGLVTAVEVDRSSGDEALDASAVKSVRHWRFQPPAGHEPMTFTLPVQFRISSS